MSTSNCPCGSELTLAKCCLPRIEGKKPAETAEALLRSRYTAFTRGNVDYILATVHPEKRDDHDREEVESWSKNSEWLSLEVTAAHLGGEEDDEGLLEFVASYRERGKEEGVSHHERSLFKKHEGAWYFFDGEPARREPFKRAEAKVGRNDPCSCGSGKKFKRCCG